MKKVIAIPTGIPAAISAAIATVFPLRQIREPHLDYIRRTGVYQIDKWPHGVLKKGVPGVDLEACWDVRHATRYV